MSHYYSIFTVEGPKPKDLESFKVFCSEIEDFYPEMELYLQDDGFTIINSEEPTYVNRGEETVEIDFESKLEMYISGVTVIKSVGFDGKHGGMHAYMVILTPGEEKQIFSIAEWEEVARNKKCNL